MEEKRPEDLFGGGNGTSLPAAKECSPLIEESEQLDVLKGVSKALGCHPNHALKAVNLLQDMLVDASKLLECVNTPCGCAMSSVAHLMRDASEGHLPDGGLDEWQHFIMSTEPCTTFSPKKRRPAKKRASKKAPKRAKQEASPTWVDPAAVASTLGASTVGSILAKARKAVAPSPKSKRTLSFCAWCGTQFFDKTGRKRFDNKSCAAKARPSRPRPADTKCLTCAVLFSPLNKKDGHCSPKCRTGKGPGPAATVPPVTAVGIKRFECVNVKSSKFWEVDITAGPGFATVSTTWGRIGTKGQSKDFTFRDETLAKAYADKQIVEKIKKGYQHTGATCCPTFSPAKVLPYICEGCGADYSATFSSNTGYCCRVCEEDYDGYEEDDCYE